MKMVEEMIDNVTTDKTKPIADVLKAAIRFAHGTDDMAMGDTMRLCHVVAEFETWMLNGERVTRRPEATKRTATDATVRTGARAGIEGRNELPPELAAGRTPEQCRVLMEHLLSQQLWNGRIRIERAGDQWQAHCRILPMNGNRLAKQWVVKYPTHVEAFAASLNHIREMHEMTAEPEEVRILDDVTVVRVDLAPDEDGVMRAWTTVKDNGTGQILTIPGGEVRPTKRGREYEDGPTSHANGRCTDHA